MIIQQLKEQISDIQFQSTIMLVICGDVVLQSFNFFAFFAISHLKFFEKMTNGENGNVWVKNEFSTLHPCSMALHCHGLKLCYVFGSEKKEFPETRESLKMEELVCWLFLCLTKLM